MQALTRITIDRISRLTKGQLGRKLSEAHSELQQEVDRRELELGCRGLCMVLQHRVWSSNKNLALAVELALNDTVFETLRSRSLKRELLCETAACLARQDSLRRSAQRSFAQGLSSDAVHDALEPEDWVEVGAKILALLAETSAEGGLLIADGQAQRTLLKTLLSASQPVSVQEAAARAAVALLETRQWASKTQNLALKRVFSVLPRLEQPIRAQLALRIACLLASDPEEDPFLEDCTQARRVLGQLAVLEQGNLLASETTDALGETLWPELPRLLEEFQEAEDILGQAQLCACIDGFCRAALADARQARSLLPSLAGLYASLRAHILAASAGSCDWEEPAAEALSRVLALLYKLAVDHQELRASAPYPTLKASGFAGLVRELHTAACMLEAGQNLGEVLVAKTGAALATLGEMTELANALDALLSPVATRGRVDAGAAGTVVTAVLARFGPPDFQSDGLLRWERATERLVASTIATRCLALLLHAGSGQVPVALGDALLDAVEARVQSGEPRTVHDCIYATHALALLPAHARRNPRALLALETAARGPLQEILARGGPTGDRPGDGLHCQEVAALAIALHVQGEARGSAVSGRILQLLEGFVVRGRELQVRERASSPLPTVRAGVARAVMVHLGRHLCGLSGVEPHLRAALNELPKHLLAWERSARRDGGPCPPDQRAPYDYYAVLPYAAAAAVWLNETQVAGALFASLQRMVDGSRLCYREGFPLATSAYAGTLAYCNMMGGLAGLCLRGTPGSRPFLLARPG